MRIVLIGAGRLATNLGQTLLGAGHEIVCVNSRTMASAKALADKIGGCAVDRAEDIPMEADAYIIAVKDSVLADVIPAVTRGRENQVFMHTAGSMPMSMFQGMAHHYGVFYPMQSFSKERPVDFAVIPTFIEANDEKAMQTIRHLAESITERIYELSSDDRQYLHLAAVFACNFTNHCCALADGLLTDAGLDFQVLLPLVEETVAKLHQLPPAEAQTGPAARRDENVMGLQRAMLANRPDLQRIYTLLSSSIMNLERVKN